MQLCLMLRGEGFKGNENQIGRVSGQVGLPKFTNTYHLNRKQNGTIVLVDFGRIFSHGFTHRISLVYPLA